MRNPEFAAAIKKIKEDCALYGRSKNHLAAPLRKHGYGVAVTDGDDGPVIERYFVTSEEVAQRQERLAQHREEFLEQLRRELQAEEQGEVQS
jgi:hypothetical protein